MTRSLRVAACRALATSLVIVAGACGGGQPGPSFDAAVSDRAALEVDSTFDARGPGADVVFPSDAFDVVRVDGPADMRGGHDTLLPVDVLVDVLEAGALVEDGVFDYESPDDGGASDDVFDDSGPADVSRFEGGFEDAEPPDGAFADSGSIDAVFGDDVLLDAAETLLPSSDAAHQDGAVAGPLPLSGELDVHDPVLFKVDDRYYVYGTGPGLTSLTSSNLLEWTRNGPVMETPTWTDTYRRAGEAQPNPDLWAPDVSHFGGKYHLYYAASYFGSNRSCIGHAVAETLVTTSPAWQDQGPVLCSNVGTTDNWNAIDPNVAIDENGGIWLTFGSFWSGIKLVALDDQGLRKTGKLYDLASRPNTSDIEAPFIVRRAPYYYLFASIGYCCRGSASTYQVVVGRSLAITGPYVDQSGLAMTKGGGTLFVQRKVPRFPGAGHNAVWQDRDGTWWNAYHAYDQSVGYASQLRIAEITWTTDGWPHPVGP